ncbi:MAG: 2Fe-2S iron-sulfur cluster binding domain-containing protein [Burkholderiales bacterium]|nr:2Fe-2S iron-sulfur cluster binding domain-containing protein [Burkholderiales bacterium]MDE2454955.1 2Fe-2S iron-sulfur cluster binding domain-containing protein [Burkholderiales bacterium]
MKITVIDRGGTAHEIEATPGWKLMEVIREAGLDIKAECGGNCICSTCHVWVESDHASQLTPKSDDEAATLDEACSLQANSRLSCQIVVGEELAGLKVTLAPDWA